jgi:hypothetical protein
MKGGLTNKEKNAQGKHLFFLCLLNFLLLKPKSYICIHTHTETPTHTERERERERTLSKSQIKK